MKEQITKLEQKAYDIRKATLEMCITAGTGHVTSCMSCIDILVALYHGEVMCHDPTNPNWPDRDRLFISKGQASPALYAILADCGYFDVSDMELFAQKGGKFGVHLQDNVPGVEIDC